MRIRYQLEGGREIHVTVHDEGLIEKYRTLDMNSFFIIAEENGSFRMAINPKKIICIDTI